jgi:L-asparaginase/Glu-tRNA(Gln) amidotransferase subunit D
MSKKKTTKVSLLLESIKESKLKYIEILTPGGTVAMKIKYNVEANDMVDFFDEFHDAGFIVKKISKQDFDDYEAEEKLNFNL